MRNSRSLKDREFDRPTAHAAAVMHVNSMIERETYELRDEHGQRQSRSGVMTWDEMAATARAVEPDELKRPRRLALPGHGRAAAPPLRVDHAVLSRLYWRDGWCRHLLC